MDPLRRVSFATKVALARQRRRVATPAERHAWSLLRNRGILGLKFRRQHVVHGFVVDFYCLPAKIILELDGAHHSADQQFEYDRARTAWLEGGGCRVIRLRNRDLTRARLEEILRPLV